MPLLLDFTLEVVAGDQIRDVVVVVLVLLAAALFLLQALVALGQLPERGEAVRSELVEDAGHELGELFVFAVAVDGEGVGGDGCVDWALVRNVVSRIPLDVR